MRSWDPSGGGRLVSPFNRDGDPATLTPWGRGLPIGRSNLPWGRTDSEARNLVPRLPRVTRHPRLSELDSPGVRRRFALHSSQRLSQRRRAGLAPANALAPPRPGPSLPQPLGTSAGLHPRSAGSRVAVASGVSQRSSANPVGAGQAVPVSSAPGVLRMRLPHPSTAAGCAGGSPGSGRAAPPSDRCAPFCPTVPLPGRDTAGGCGVELSNQRPITRPRTASVSRRQRSGSLRPSIRTFSHSLPSGPTASCVVASTVHTGQHARGWDG